MLEGKDLSEVRAWDLEDLDAFLAVRQMRIDTKSVAHTMVTEKGKHSGDSSGASD